MALSKEKILQGIRSVGIVPVLRGDNEDQVLRMAEAIAAGGVTSLEVTMTVPNAIRVIERLVHDRTCWLVRALCLILRRHGSACWRARSSL